MREWLGDDDKPAVIASISVAIQEIEALHYKIMTKLY
jgi:hypothetical protein